MALFQPLTSFYKHIKRNLSKRYSLLNNNQKFPSDSTKQLEQKGKLILLQTRIKFSRNHSASPNNSMAAILQIMTIPINSINNSMKFEFQLNQNSYQQRQNAVAECNLSKLRVMQTKSPKYRCTSCVCPRLE